jgi:hypothetical protein
MKQTKENLTIEKLWKVIHEQHELIEIQAGIIRRLESNIILHTKV